MTKPQTSVTKFSAFHGIVRTLQLATLFFIASYLLDLGFGAKVGAIFTISLISSLITMLPSGLSNDKFKSKNLITIGLILESTQYLGLVLFESFWPIAICFFIGGLGHNLYKTSADSLFYRLSKDEGMAKKIASFNNATYYGAALSIALSGYVLTPELSRIHVSFETLFLIIAISLITMAIASQFLVGDKEKSEIVLIQYKKDLIQPKVLIFLLVMFLFHSQFAVNTTSYSPFLEQNLGLNKFHSGLFMAGAILPMTLITYYISKLKGKIKTHHILIVGILMAAVGNMLVATSILEISFAARIINEMGNAAFFFFTYYGINKLFDLKRVGGNSSIFALTGALGSAAGTQLFSPIGETYGYQYSFLLSGAIILLALLIVIPYLKHFIHD